MWTVEVQKPLTNHTNIQQLILLTHQQMKPPNTTQCSTPNIEHTNTAKKAYYKNNSSGAVSGHGKKHKRNVLAPRGYFLIMEGATTFLKKMYSGRLHRTQD